MHVLTTLEASTSAVPAVSVSLIHYREESAGKQDYLIRISCLYLCSLFAGGSPGLSGCFMDVLPSRDFKPSCPGFYVNFWSDASLKGLKHL